MEGPIDFLHGVEGKKLLAFNPFPLEHEAVGPTCVQGCRSLCARGKDTGQDSDLTHKPHLLWDLSQSLRLSESPCHPL